MQSSGESRIRRAARPLLVAGVVACMAGQVDAQTPLGTAFTYQGRLKDAGIPVDDTADFQFSLYDALSDGNLVAGPVAVNNVAVAEGLFTVSIDFGAAAFDGEARWLEVAARSPAGSGSFATLAPRQRLSAAPYALKVPGVDGHSLDAADGSPSDAVFVDNSGNIGIGTASPNFPLSFGSTLSHTKLALYETSATNSYGMGVVSGQFSFHLGGSGARYAFYDSADLSNEVFTIKGSGNVGIGTSNPQTPLHVLGNGNVLALEGADHAYLEYYPDSFAAGRKAWMGFGGATSNNFEIRNQVDGAHIILSATGAGNVGIGTTNPAQRLHVNGSVQASCGILTCSDARFKENVEPVRGALDKIEQLRGVTFDWKRTEFADRQFAEGRQVGFIAQETEKVLPQIVQRGSDGYLSIDYGRLAPVLVEALKEEATRVRALESENKELRQRLDRLERMIERLDRPTTR